MNATLSVHQATLADLDDLTSLFDGYRQFYGKSSDLPAARAFLRQRFEHGESTLFVARQDGAAVGFCQLYPSFSSVSLARTFILNDLFVLPSARRAGLGQALLEAAIGYGKALGAVRLTLSTAISNETAQALYQAAGWARDQQFYVYHYALPA